eukprot:GHVN01029097.1.p1 GENE.GHVN01029097.1~~GHVN01029097.1.p1  ORF type:complete len:620 (+),score=102.95 GHVN01029097.1:47-1906(+)
MSFDPMEGENAPPEADGVVEPPKKLRKTRWGRSSLEVEPSGEPPKAAPTAAAAAPPLNFDINAAAAAAKAALEKAKKAALFRQQMNEQRAANLKAQSSFTPAPPAAPPQALLKFDQYGREVDDEGHIVPIKPMIQSTLKVNINIEKEQRLRAVFQSRRIDKHLQNAEKNKWYDPNQVAVKKSRKKAFRFIEQGSYSKREQQMMQRAEALSMGIDVGKIKAQRRELQKGEEAADQKSDEEGPDNPNLIPLGGGNAMAENDSPPSAATAGSGAELSGGAERPSGTGPGIERVPISIQKRMKDPTPEVEWWDAPLVAADPKAGLDSDFPFIINVLKVTHYVEHPIPIHPLVDADKALVTTMHLTPGERKKLRRRKRQEAEREKQDKIRMGLMPPPPPKVKLSNLMRALGAVAVADPSKVEKRVRQQMEQRIKQHEARNEARKLDPHERSKKKAMKWQNVDATTSGVGSCAFSVRDLSSKRNMFKVDRNASQVHLTGACVICPNVANLVVVEGSNKALKHFKKLMLRRIKWTEPKEGEADHEPDDEDSDDETEEMSRAPEENPDVCLLWEGVIRDRLFKQWKVYTAKTETEARKLMADRSSAHYWDMARKHKFPPKGTLVPVL